MTSALSGPNAARLRADARKQQLQLLGLSAPAVVLVLVIIVIPVGWLFWLSLFNDDGVLSLDNYRRMLDNKSYARIFRTTFNVSILTTLICVLIGYPLTYFLAQLPRRAANIAMIAVLLPFWTSLLVRTYAWLVVLQRKGLINQWGMELGLWEQPLRLVHNLNGTLIGMVHIMLPFLVLPLYGTIVDLFFNFGAASALGVVLLLLTLIILYIAHKLLRLDKVLGTGAA